MHHALLFLQPKNNFSSPGYMYTCSDVCMSMRTTWACTLGRTWLAYIRMDFATNETQDVINDPLEELLNMNPTGVVMTFDRSFIYDLLSS